MNGNLVDIPSIQVKPGDKIELKDQSNDLIIVQHTIDTGQDREPASWLKVDEKKKNIEVLNQPTRNSRTLFEIEYRRGAKSVNFTKT